MSSCHISTRFKENGYINKSMYIEYKFGCKYRCRRFYIDEIEKGINNAMRRGTNTHFLYQEFFDKIDLNYLWNLDWESNINTFQSPVYQYFYAVLTAFLPPDFNDARIFNNIKAFCLFESTHWSELRREIRNRVDVIKYWKPISYEEMHYSKALKLFGTWDRVQQEPQCKLIVDYKTGKVPAAVQRMWGTGDYAKCTDLPAKYNPEGTIYVILAMDGDGYEFKRNPEDDNKWYIYKDGKVANKDIKLYDFCFMFTGGMERATPKIHVVRKKTNIVSIRKILDTLEEIRANENWERCCNPWICKNCELYELECKDVIPFEVYRDIQRSEDTTQEDISDDE